MSESPSVFLMIVGFLLVLGPLVTLHELGHLLVGRWCGVRVDAFSIGFGRPLLGWTDRHGTHWRVSALPLGGYVQFAGDMNPASQPSPEWLALPREERSHTFQGRPLWQRALIVAAGPFANFAVAVAILAAFNLAYGKYDIPPVVSAVTEEAAAAGIGLQPGDRILAVDGSKVETFEELRNRVVPNPGVDMILTVRRDGRDFDTHFVVPEVIERDTFGNEFRIGRLGVLAAPGDVVPVGPVEAVAMGVRQTGDIVVMMAQGIGQILTGRRSVEELGGPIKIAKYSGEQLSLGPQAFTWFVALISINLAFINLLPIPALDGGHLAFYALEAVRRKPVGQRSQEWAFRTGMALMLALMFFVTINDLISLPIFGS
ncbi:MAG: RIP metalloprotease RseP [Novosphingobium sp.]|nr:RIP metalloprotease RseP [Novosphingobium sp.]